MSTRRTSCPAPHDSYNRPNPRSRYTLDGLRIAVLTTDAYPRTRNP